MIPTVIIAGEGSNLKNQYIPREVSIYYVNTKTVNHFHFDPPTNFSLDRANQKTDAFIRNELGGIGVFTVIPGARPQSEVTSVITNLGGYRIFCAGSITRRWLQTILPYGDIIDVQESTKFVYPKELVFTWCGYFHKNVRYCSLAKLWTLVYFLKFNGEI